MKVAVTVITLVFMFSQKCWIYMRTVKASRGLKLSFGVGCWEFFWRRFKQ